MINAAWLRRSGNRAEEEKKSLSVLSELAVGESGILVSLELPDSVQNHLMHMGFVPDARVIALRRAPAGDPTVYAIDGMEIALRHETAGAIQIRSAEEPLVAVQPHGTQKPISSASPKLIEAAR
jgi:Fe2+ transport system protein FeoA